MNFPLTPSAQITQKQGGLKRRCALTKKINIQKQNKVNETDTIWGGAFTSHKLMLTQFSLLHRHTQFEGLQCITLVNRDLSTSPLRLL